MLKRVLAGTGANGYAQLATIAIQLGSLPAFLIHWDLETYGRWLVLSAIPSYLALADVGMVTAAGNRMTMLADREPRAATRVFQSATLFLLGVSVLAALLTLASLTWLPAGWLPADGRAAIALLALGVILSLLGGLPEAVYRATGRYAQGTAASTHVRLLEWAGGMAGLILVGSFVAVALGMLLCRALGTAVFVLCTLRRSDSIRWGLREASREELRALLAPAAYFMAFPIGNALAFQGFTLLVAGVLGPAQAAVFNAYRTLARVTVQATGTFSHALWPELSRMYGSDDRRALSRVFRKAQRIGVGVALAAGLVVLAISPWILELWSHGRIGFELAPMLIAMAYAAAAGCWHLPRVLLLSTNRHRGLALQFLAVTAVSLLLAASLMRISPTLSAAFGAMLAAEFVLLGLSLRGSLSLLRSPAPIAKGAAA